MRCLCKHPYWPIVVSETRVFIVSGCINLYMHARFRFELVYEVGTLKTLKYAGWE